MSTICDHPHCGAPAKRLSVEVNIWHRHPVFRDETEEVTYREFSADLCDHHADKLLQSIGTFVKERDDG